MARSRLPVIALLALLAACSRVDEPGQMTCAVWLETSAVERLALADQLVGASGDLLERIRIRQHQPEGTPRDALIRDVASGITKNCEVWPPPTRRVDEVMVALYR